MAPIVHLIVNRLVPLKRVHHFLLSVGSAARLKLSSSVLFFFFEAFEIEGA
jgi:hypothetical protein